MVVAKHKLSPLVWALLALAGIAGVTVLPSCGVAGRRETALPALRGTVHGGQQPVSGASIQLYAAGSAGYGSAATALLGSAVTSDSSGNFTISGLYSCPDPASQVYLVATGGNPGLSPGTNNAALALMAALGPCGNLNSSTFVNIDEVTTVASVYALAPFMAVGGGANTGTTDTPLQGVGGNVQGLVNAFATVPNLVNTANGTAPGPNLPSGATVPVSELNTLADILATCVNTNGSSSACTDLFIAATPSGGSAPLNTLDSILDIAQNPSNNVSTLYNLLTGTPPFQPTLSSPPNDWTIAVNYTGGGLSFPFDVAVDSSGNIWTGNLGNASLSKFSPTGTALSPSSGYSGGGLSGSPFSIAIDGGGDVWTANEAPNNLSEFSNAGTALSPSVGYTDSSLNNPAGIAFDVAGNVWVVNFGSDSLSEFSSSATVLSPPGGYTGSIDGPGRIAIDNSASIWVPNRGGFPSLHVFSNNGILASGMAGYTGGGMNDPFSLAIDASGNIWITNPPTDVISEFSNRGTPVSPSSGYAGGGGDCLAIDGLSHVWIESLSGESVGELANDGTLISGSSGYTGGGLVTPAGIAIDGSGNVWVANENSSTLIEFVGAAAPVVTPLATALRANMLGTRP